MAKKKHPEQDIRRGLEELQQSGIATDDLSPTIVPDLKKRLGKRREIDLAVVFALGKIVHAAAVDALTDIEKNTVEKEIRKEVRRSLFKLGQRGLALPQGGGQDAASRSQAPFLGFDSKPEIEAYMSPVDGEGGRLVWISKPHTGHGLQLIQAMLNDREGLLRIGGAQIPRKELRRMTQDIKEQHGAAMIAIPWEYADRTLYEGYEKAKSRGQSGLENFHELRSIIALGKPKEQSHPIYSKLDAEAVRDGDWREASRKLLDEPELRYWILTENWLHLFLSQLQEAQTSRLVLNPVQKEERFAVIVREAVKELCNGEFGKAFQRRMEDMALYFNETGRVVQAGLALAVALQVGEGDPGPFDISFLTGLVQKSFAISLSQQKAKKEEEPSLIIKP